MKSLGWTVIPCDSFIKRRNLDSKIHKQGRCCEGIQVKMAIYNSRGEAGIDVFLTALRGNQSLIGRCLDFGLSKYRTVRKYVSVT